MVIYLQRDANNLHMVQLMPLPPVISCFIKIPKQQSLPAAESQNLSIALCQGTTSHAVQRQKISLQLRASFFRR